MIEYLPSIKKLKPAQAGLTAFGGAVCGLIILLFMELSMWWLILTILGISLLYFAAVSANAKRIFVMTLAFILPLNVDVRIDSLLGTYLQRYLQDLSISLSTLIIILLYILWIVELSRNKNQIIYFFPKTTVPALLLIGISALSIIVNMSVFFNTFAEIVLMVFEFSIYFYIANNIKSENDVKYVVWVFLAGAFLQCGIATLEIWSGSEFTRNLSESVDTVWQMPVGDRIYSRVSGTMGHANILAVYLSFIIIMLLSLFFAEHRKLLRSIYWLGAGFALYIIVNTFSRSAWFVLVMFVPFISLVYYHKLGSLRKTALPLLLFLLIIAVGSFVLSAKIINRITVDESVMSRIPLMEDAIEVIQNHPFLGIGQSNYYEMLNIGNVHNIYLFIAAETGIIGLLIFLWFNVAIFLEAWFFVKSDISFLANVGLAFSCLIFMFFLYGMVNPFPSRIEYIFIYFALGMIVGIKKILNERKPAVSQG